MKKLYSFILLILTVVLGASAVAPVSKFSRRPSSAPLKIAQSTINTVPVVVFEEDFSKFTEGSEQTPASTALPTDWGGAFDESKVSVQGWGGNGVYEAGGAAFIRNGGLLWSPTINIKDAVVDEVLLTFRARLAENAEEGVPSIRMGYGTEQQLPELKSEWQNYELTISGAYSGADFTFSANSDWLIDDIRLVKYVAYIEAPVGLTFNNYTGTGFRASWEPVEGADHYVVNVYTIDDLLETLSPAVMGLETTECFLDIADLPESDSLYCFSVTAVDADGNCSTEAQPLLVEALFTPVTNDATDVTAHSFNASWQAIDGALFYDFYVYRTAEIKEAGDFPILDTDFSFITPSTTSDEYTVSFDLLPGWFVAVPMFEDGVLGLDGAKAPIETTYFAHMESPCYDLSAAGGEVEITVSAKSTRGAKLTFSLFTMKNGSYSAYPESYVAVEGLPFEEFETRTFKLTGGGKNSTIYIEAADWGQVWITDLKIVQHVKPGETVAAPVLNRVTEDNFINVTDVDLADGYQHYYTLRAVGISRDEEYYISSDYTAPHFVAFDAAGLDDVTLGVNASVTVESGAIRVDNPSGLPVSVVDIAGGIVFESEGSAVSELIRPSQRGVYIVRVGDIVSKVSL